MGSSSSKAASDGGSKKRSSSSTSLEESAQDGRRATGVDGSRSSKRLSGQRQSSPSAVEEAAFYAEGDRVLLYNHGTKGWQRGYIKARSFTFCQSWRAHYLWDGETMNEESQLAFVVVATDDEGDECLLSFNGTNCDPLCNSFAGRHMRKQEQGSHIQEPNISYTRTKTLKSSHFGRAGLDKVQLVCATSDDGEPSVVVRWSVGTGVLMDVLSDPFAAEREVIFTGTVLLDEGMEELCLLLLCRAYLFVHLLTAFVSQSLPDACSEWRGADLYQCASMATSNSVNGYFSASNLHQWTTLKLPSLLQDRHPWSAVRSKCSPPSKTSCGNVHFSFLAKPSLPQSSSSSLSPEPSAQEQSRRTLDRALSSLHHGRNAVDVDEENVRKIERFLSGEDSGRPKLDDIVASLEGKAHARQMFDDMRVPEDERDGAAYLAYVVAMLMLASLHLHATVQLPDVTEMLLESNPEVDPLGAFTTQTPLLLRIFLWTFASSRCRETELGAAAGNSGFYRYLGSTQKAADGRALALHGVFAGMLGANVSAHRGGVLGDAFQVSGFQDLVAVVLLLDGEGPSDRVLQRLERFNIAKGPDKGRDALVRASRRLSLEFVFPKEVSDEGDETVPALGFSGDNADIHMWGKVWSFICLSAISLGFVLTLVEIAVVNKGLQKDQMPNLSHEICTAMALDPLDCGVIDELKWMYSVHALCYAHNLSEVAAEGAPTADEKPLAVGDEVTFLYLHHPFSGKVDRLEGNNCTVSFAHANGDDAEHTLPQASVRQKDSEEDSSGHASPMLEDPASPATEDDADDDEAEEKGRHWFPRSSSWVCDVLCNVSSKHSRATVQVVQALSLLAGPTYILFIGVDFEFYVCLAMLFFLSGMRLIPMIAPGHLLKAVATSSMSYYEMLFVRDHLRASGYVAGSPSYLKMMNGKHISHTNKFLVRVSYTMRVALAVRFLRERGGDVFGTKTILETISTLGSGLGPYRTAIILDQDSRPTVQYANDELMSVAQKFEAWAFAETGGGGPTDDAARPNEGVFGPDVEDAYIWIARLPLNSKGSEAGARQLCVEAGISLPPRCSRAIACQRLYSYMKAGGGDPGRETAAAVTEDTVCTLPEVPVDANVNLKAAVEFIFRATPPFLIIAMATRVRTPNVRGAVEERLDLNGCKGSCSAKGFSSCRCTSRHLWLVGLKGLLVSVYMRRQPNYQRALVLFLAFVICVLFHQTQQFTVLVMTMIESSLALSKFGDSWKCEPLDLKQEANVGQTKRAARRKPSAWKMAALRVRLYSYMEYLREKAAAAAKVSRGAFRPQAMSAAALNEEQRGFDVLLRVSLVKMDEIFEAKGSDCIAGAMTLKINHPKRVFYNWSNAKNSAAAATRGVVQGLRENMAVSLPTPMEPATSAMHTKEAALSREAAKESKALSQLRLKNTVQAMAAGGTLLLPDDAAMFEGKCGDSKAELSLELLSRYGASLSLTGLNSRPPFLVFKTEAIKSEHMQQDNQQWVKIVDLLLHLQQQPAPRSETAPDDLKELARSVVVLCSKYFSSYVWMVVVCIDTAEYITWLRDIQRRKRGKTQSGRALEVATQGQWDSDDPLEKMGGYHSLMASKQGGVERLFAEVAFQVKTPNAVDGWDPLEYIKEGTALCFVGGFAGGATVLMNGTGTTFLPGSTPLTSKDLTSALRGVEKQGEGEAMIFLAGRRFLILVAERCGPSIAASLAIEFVSSDVDALGGRSMAEMQRMLDICERLGVPTSLLRVHLTLHPKSGPVLRKLGVLVQGQNGSSSQARADGRFLLASCDLLSLRLAIEADPRAAGGGSDPGAKAVAATAAILALTDNDMLAGMKGGMSIAAVCRAFYSDEFLSLAAKFGVLVGSSSIGGANALRTFTLSTQAAQMLIYVGLKNRPRTLRRLGLRYTPPEMLSDTTPIPYAAVEAASFVGSEEVPAPPLIAIFSRLSCAQAVFSQFANWLALDEPRPLSVSQELSGTSYVSGDDQVVRPKYTINLSAARNEEAIVVQLRRQFGPIVDQGAPEGFMFPDPKTTLVDTFRRRGASDRTVPAPLIIANGIVLDSTQLALFKRSEGPYEGCEENHLLLHAVALNSLVHHTAFNPQGLGRPQLSSATVDEVASNRGAWGNDDGEAEEILPAEANTKLSGLLAALKAGLPDSSHTQARSVLFHLVVVVVKRACALTSPAVEDEDEEDEEEGDEDEDAEEEPEDQVTEGGDLIAETDCIDEEDEAEDE